MSVRKHLVFVFTILTLLLGSFAFYTLADKSDEKPADLEKRALKAYTEKTYSKALPLYEKLLASKASAAVLRDAELKVVICLARLRQYDKSLERGQAYAKALAGTVWAGRHQRTLGGIWYHKPHYGYRKGGKTTWGRHVQGGTYVNSQASDMENAVKSYEAARNNFLALDAMRRVGQVKKGEAPPLPEILGTNGELATALSMLSQRRYHRLRPGFVINPPKVYDIKKLNLEERLIFIYDELYRLAAEGGQRRVQAVALYHKGMHFRRMRNYRRQQDSSKLDPAVPELIKRYRDPIPLFERLLAQFPKQKIVVDARIALGMMHRMQGRYLAAKTQFERVIEDFPKSTWVSDAKHYIAYMTREEVTVTTLGHFDPKAKKEVTIGTRNLKDFTVRIYPFDLAGFSNEGSILSDYRISLGQINSVYHSLALVKKYAGKQLGQSSHRSGDRGDHKYRRTPVVLPQVSGIGAYLVEVAGRQVTRYTLAVVTDIALVKKLDKDRVLLWVADARTGQPKAGAKLLVKERYRGGQRVQINRGVSDETGVADIPRVKNFYYGSVDAIAHLGGKRYALSVGAYSHYHAQGQAQHRIYTYTDRPVYRPGHKVYFKAIVRTYENGKYGTVAGQPVEVRVRGPRGKDLLKTTLRTNEVGTIHGEADLGQQAALGTYYVYTRIPGTRKAYYHASSNRFRVEEYKKPEYEVTIKAEAAHIKLGQPASARISAKYYFGGNVLGAKVKYQIYRDSYRHVYHWPGPYDWLYGRGYGLRYITNLSYRNNWYFHHDYLPQPRSGELVKQGEGRLDDEGKLIVKFETAKYKKDSRGGLDHRFRITAQVTDQSRRTITGQGSVIATRQAFTVHVDSRQLLYRPGDRTEIRMRAMTPSDTPVQAAGKIKVYRIKLAGTGKIGQDGHEQVRAELTQVHEDELATAKNGFAFYRWAAKESGRYRILFETKDSWGEVVQGYKDLWIVTDDYNGNKFRFKGIEILTDKRSYEKGQKVRLMINTEQRGAHVLLCTEVGHEIVRYQVIKMKGRSKIVYLTLDNEHVPNFFLSAISVSGGHLLRERRQMFCPPTDRFLNVDVSTDKSEYQPGGKGQINVKVTDDKGQPVSDAEVSVAAIDRSVLYIQSDFGQGPKKFYYGHLRGQIVKTYTSWRYRSGIRWFDRRTKIGHRTHGYPYGWHGWYHMMNRDFDDQRNETMDRFSFRFRSPVGVKLAKGEMKRNSSSAGGAAGKRSAPRPASAERESQKKSDLGSSSRRKGAEGLIKHGGNPATPKQIKVRSKFADTALWRPVLVTDAKGQASLEITYPENLTAWRIKAYGVTGDSRIGEGQAQTRTRKELIVRLQAPRFFTERDEVVLSAVINNNLAKAQQVTARIEVSPLLQAIDTKPRKITIKGNGVARVDWRVKVVGEGTATVTMFAQGPSVSDAMRKTFPVYVHGITKFVARNGAITGDKPTDSRTVSLRVPGERRVESTRLTVQLTPSLASAMLDALPYLASYPYGCIEQTLSRFVPTVVAKRTLKDLGIDLKELAGKRREMNAKHLASRPWSRFGKEPVFSGAVLDDMVQAGLRRVYAWQKWDGGWGWWYGGPSDMYMTAYAIYALQLARESGLSIRAGVVERGLKLLEKQVTGDTSLYRRAFMAYVLSRQGRLAGKVIDRLYLKRDKLNLYGQAMVALALANIGDKKRSNIMIDNFDDHAKVDTDNNTVRFMGETNQWWYWYNDEVEANSWILRAYLKIRPKTRYGPMLVKWLLNGRKGMRWKSTKTTAFVMFGLAEWIKASDELNPEMRLTVKLGDKVLRTIDVSRKNVLTFDNKIYLHGEDVPSGEHQLTIEKSGKGNVYFGTGLEYFTLEEDIQGAGHEIFIKRRYYKLIPQVKKITVGDHSEKRLTYKRELLSNGVKLSSGQLVEVELEIDSKNDYEYLCFEDRKPAGLETVAVKSGYFYKSGLSFNRELRDEKVVYFVNWLQQGKHTFKYRMRAEIPGTFHAMPTLGYAMYAPRVRGLADEFRVSVTD